MQHQKHHTQANSVRNNPQTFEPAILPPCGSIRIPLGRYRSADPDPQFDIKYEPTPPHGVTHELIELPVDDSSYTLTGQFQSFHDAPIIVTVRRKA